jgi:succinate dehydrogenase assembly factor 2
MAARSEVTVGPSSMSMIIVESKTWQDNLEPAMSMSARLTRHSRALVIPRHTYRLFSSGDPFVLPLSREATHRGAPTETPLPPRIQRDNETVAALRARLVYQSRKRGMLEGDLILSTFAAEHLPSMSEQELLEYDRVSLSDRSISIVLIWLQLLDEPDWDIYYWSIEKKDPPERWANTELLKRLQIHARNEGRVVRKMPDLH